MAKVVHQMQRHVQLPAHVELRCHALDVVYPSLIALIGGVVHPREHQFQRVCFGQWEFHERLSLGLQ
ncbi:hypothetical protein D3C81_2193920 [compost metagenome]